jgi:predicted ATPase
MNMYIRKFRVRNFMVHQDTSIELQPLTVLVGPNGGGKSALFDSMLNFSMLSRGNLRQAFGPYPYSFRATLHRGASRLARIGFEVTMSRHSEDDVALTYATDYAQQGPAEEQPSFLIFNEKLTRLPDQTVLFDRSNPESYPMSEHLHLENDRSLFSAVRLRGGNASGEIDPLLDYVTQQISRFNKFRLDPAVLAAPSRLPELGIEPDPARAPRLGYHGEDLASTLYYLSETDSPVIERIQARIREVIPEFEGFDFNTVGTDRIAFAVRYSDRRETIPSVRLSSGMLIYIGLIVLVSIPNRPPVLMIEEPENGLTPQAVKAFYQAVRTLAFDPETENRSQVLLSSHSPFVICEAWNGEDRDFIHQVKLVFDSIQ